MTAPGNNLLQIALALAFVIASGYASGRIHQWYRHGLERDHAYREGYNHASHSMFTMALQARGHTIATGTPAPGPDTGQHLSVAGADRSIGAARRRIIAANQRAAHDPGRRRHAA
jgi:hypothetical protein